MSAANSRGSSTTPAPLRRRWLRPVAFGTAALGLALVLPPSCGGDETPPEPEPEPPETPVARVEVTVEYPSAAVESTVAALHLWLVRADEEGEVTCAKLVGGALYPNDGGLIRLGDAVSGDTDATLAADGVELGRALAHVEAGDFSGNHELAGCVEIEVVQPVTTATIVLEKANVYDCADPATEEGAPCDDGELCTIGETCEDGDCRGGLVRDCTHVADECNAESCVEGIGCVPVRLANNTVCEDGLYCTDGDVCTDGRCLGEPRDCSLGLNPCEYVVQCDETWDECDIGTRSNYYDCDDGLFCNGWDECWYGDCTLHHDPPCDGPGDGDADCTETCDEDNDNCDGEDFLGASCDDTLFCTVHPETCTNGVCGSATTPCVGPDGDNDCKESCRNTPGDCLGNDPVNSPCDDLNPGTTNDHCDVNGNCVGT